MRSPTTPLSTLSVPVAVPLDEVSGLVNDVVPQDLHHMEDYKIRKGIARASLDLDVRRNGRIAMSTRKGYLLTSIPLRAEGRLRVPPGVSRSFSTTFTVHASSIVRLNEDWTTSSRTSSSFTWDDPPEIKLLGFTIDVSGVAGKQLTKQLERLAPRIDEMIEKRVNFRGRVEQLWETLAEPIPLRKEPPVWLQIRPQRALFFPGSSKPDTLIYGLAVEAYIETIVGTAPVPLPADSLAALLDLVVLDDVPADAVHHAFTIFLPVSVSYDDVNRMLGERVAGRRYDVKERVEIKAREIEVYGHGASLVARVDFSADVPDALLNTRGRVYLTGKPVYDPATRTVRIDSFDYDMQSKHALAGPADWIFREEFLEQTRARLTFSLGDRIDSARVQLESALRERQIGKHLVLQGLVNELLPGELYLVAEGIQVDLIATGQIKATVANLDEVRRKRKK